MKKPDMVFLFLLMLFCSSFSFSTSVFTAASEISGGTNNITANNIMANNIMANNITANNVMPDNVMPNNLMADIGPEFPAVLNVDFDGNGIDDIIDAMLKDDPGGHMDIFVNYDGPIGHMELKVLEVEGIVPSFVSRYINALIVENVDVDTINRLLALPNVVNIEYAPTFYPLLETSVRAVKARASDFYPNSVWDDLGLSGKDVNVAIIDSGVDDVLHSGLRAKFVAGVDTTGPLIVVQNPDDDVGHGTHCAGIIMGTGGGKAEDIGVAPESGLVDCRVGDAATLGSATPTNFMEGLEWVRENSARYNISVLSISMGTAQSSNGQDASSRLANEVVDAGVTVVVAIGNDENGQNANVVSSPAAADKVITVGALNERNTVDRDDDVIAGYSQRGPRPPDGDGDEMDEMKPDLVAPGSDISSCAHNTPNAYVTFSGTSMATPHVSGIVALMEQAYSALTPVQIKSILRRNSQKKGTPSYPSSDEKYNFLYGWGMVDAYSAVRRAVDLTSSDFNIPGYVDSGTRLKVRSGIDLFRSSHIVQNDELELLVELPQYFSKPENITVSVGQGSNALMLESEVYSQDDHWNVKISVEIGSTGGMDVEVIPELEFFTTSPQVGAEKIFEFIMGGVLNAVALEPSSGYVTVGSAENKPDLVIRPEDITFSKSPADSGDVINIEGEVNNVGKSNTFDVTVEFYDGNPASGIFIGDDTIDVVAESTSIANITWIATAGPVHNIFVVVDPDDEIDELSENNNTASKPLIVKGGVNSPPVAQLTSSPGGLADVKETIRFSGEQSEDYDGAVTEWQFYFGDGNESGWIPVDYVYHQYQEPGNYTPHLVVRDNGGKNSTNDASINIQIKDIMGSPMGLYVRDETSLTTMAPDDEEEKVFPCPDGYTPYPFPSSPVGIVEYKSLGRWALDFSEESVDIVEKINLDFWVQNALDDRGFDVQFQASLAVSGEVVFQVETPATNIEPGSPPMQFSMSGEVGEIKLKYRTRVELSMDVKVNGDGLEFVYGSVRYPSGVVGKCLPVDNELPLILEAENVTGEVYESIVHTIVATDPGGLVVEYRWDFDNDLFWDVVTEDAHVTHSYDAPDEYPLNVMVVDDDGASVLTQITAFVYDMGKSLPPTLTIEYPLNNTTFQRPVYFSGRASDDRDISAVLISFDSSPWHKISDNETWEVYVDIYELGSGKHEFRACAVDVDNLSSAEAVVIFFVEILNYPPVIESSLALPAEVGNQGDESIALTVVVSDPEGFEDVGSVVADLGAFGLGEVAFSPEGEGVYHLVFTVPYATPLGPAIIQISVTDLSGMISRENLTVNIVARNALLEIDVTGVVKVVDITNSNEWVLTVKVTDPDGMEDIEMVTIDLSSIGGSRDEKMWDNGLFGDEEKNDGSYTLVYLIPEEMSMGVKSFTISARDKQGVVVDVEISVRFSRTTTNDENVSPEIFSISPLIYWILGVVIFLVLCFFIYTMSKKW